MNEQIAANETATAAKPRKGWVAFLLSIFWPGLGQIYAGAPLRAVVVFGLYLFVIVPFVFLIRTSLTRTLAGFFVFAVLTVEMTVSPRGVAVFGQADRSASLLPCRIPPSLPTCGVGPAPL